LSQFYHKDVDWINLDYWEACAEILTNIFSDAITCGILPKQTIPHQLLRISWVSRSWRAVALGCASLWTHISGQKPHWLNESIRRSGQVPLTMDLMIMNSTITGTAPFLEYIPRIKELRVRMDNRMSWGERKEISLFWRSPAPLLEYLEVERAALPEDLFSGEAPNLQSVSFRNCQLRLSGTPFSSVKELTIGKNGTADGPSVASLLSTLRGMPLLTKLQLIDLEEDLESNTNYPSVHLPNLENLHLSEPWIEVAIELMEHLSYPLNTKIRIEPAEIIDPTEFERLLDSAERGHNSNNVLDTIEATSSRRNHICFGYRSPAASNSPSPEVGGSISLDPPTGSLSDLFRRISGHRFQTLSALTMMQDQMVSVETWRQVFGPLPHLRKLRLACSPASKFLLYLVKYHPHRKSDIQTYDPVGNPLITFPALETLGFDWTSRNYLFDFGFNYRVLRDVLALRQELGRGMKRWYVPGVVWNAGVVEMMLPFVENLEVEEYDDYTEDMVIGEDEDENR
ncbi:hypothetical protein BDN72DRAFT_940751, partial [Pluteus cervinus]